MKKEVASTQQQLNQPQPQSQQIKQQEAPQSSPAPPVQVTAQLLQTPQGPRIVLQGIQGSNLPKEDLALIQQQVKNQLLRAQGEAKSEGKVPPTKIVIDLPPSIQAKLQQQPEQVKDQQQQPAPQSPQKQKMLVVPQQGQKVLGVQQQQQQVLANAKQLLSTLTPTPPAKSPTSSVTGPPDNVQKILRSPTAGSVPSVIGVQKPAASPEKAPATPTSPIASVLANLSPVPQAPATSPAPPVSLPSSPIPPVQVAWARSKSGGSSNKRRSQLHAKLQQMLFRQKELLKKDIGKKRCMQEKELQVKLTYLVLHM